MTEEVTRQISQNVAPCVLHSTHSPVTVVNELHHLFPMEWQRDIWGEVRDRETRPVCSTAHNTIHAAIRYYDKNGVWPTYCVGATRDMAEEAINRREKARA
jgi:hypothetical protein